MRSSRVAFFDLLGWHLTPAITNDGAWHLGAMATKQLRWPPNNNNLTNSYWSIGSTKNMKEDRAHKQEKWGTWKQSFHAVDTCRYWVLTRLRRNVSFIDPMAPIGAIGSHCRPVRFGSISKVFSALIIVLPKVISGAPLGLL